MRALAVVCIVAFATLSLASPAVAVPSKLTMTSVTVRDIGTVLAWVPVAGATTYDVYRTTVASGTTYLGTTSMPFLVDPGFGEGRVIYTIVPMSAIPGVNYASSECVTYQDSTVEIQVRDCAGSSGGPGQ